jgi:hypothetical protein
MLKSLPICEFESTTGFSLGSAGRRNCTLVGRNRKWAETLECLIGNLNKSTETEMSSVSEEIAMIPFPWWW